MQRKCLKQINKRTKKKTKPKLCLIFKFIKLLAQQSKTRQEIITNILTSNTLLLARYNINVIFNNKSTYNIIFCYLLLSNDALGGHYIFLTFFLVVRNKF